MSTSISRLPRGWITAQLVDLISDGPTNGYSPKSGPDATGTSSFKLSATTQGRFILTEKIVKRLYEEIEPESKYWLEPGDVLVQRANSLEYLGATAIYDGNPGAYIYPDMMMRIRINDPVIRHWIWRFFNCSKCRTYFRSKATGTAGNMPKINGKTLKGTPIPLPPVHEQRRIVAKIEALQERSGRAREALEAIPPLLEKFRQSVLASAFRGDLTKDWREQHPDVEPASVLLERIRKERRKRWEEAELAKMKAKGKVPKGDGWKKKYKEPEPVDTEGLPELPEGWSWARLEELAIADGIFDGARDHGAGTNVHQNLRTADYTDSGVRVVRLENVQHLSFIHDCHTYISEEKFAGLRKSEVREGDILVGSFIGDKVRVCSMPLLNTPSVAKADCFCVRLDNEYSIEGYLEYQLAGEQILQEFKKKAHGLTRLRITTSQLRSVPVALCPLDEQGEMVRKLRTSLQTISDLEQRIGRLVAQLEQCDASVLSKAFHGELVPQDPNDEPAAVLLERIRAEREAAEPKKRSRQRSSEKSKTTPLQINTAEAPSSPQVEGAKSPIEESQAPSSDNDEPEVSFLEMDSEDRANMVHEALFGLGELDWDEAVKEAASSLREDRLIEYQRLRKNGKVYVAVDKAIEGGLEYGWFDQPEDGVVRAILTDPKEYEAHHWFLPLLMALRDGSSMDEGDAVRAAAEYARDHAGLEFQRMPSGGVIDKGIREAFALLLEEGMLRRTRSGKIVLQESE